MGTSGRAERRYDEQPLPLLAPMLAVTAPGLPADADRFGFEPKLDGFRGLAFVEGGRLRLRSRSGAPMHDWLPELAVLGQALPGRRLILDGEVVALAHGRPSFEALQQRMRTRRRPGAGAAPAMLLVFDLLWLDDELLTGQPYRRRRELLDQLELTGPICQTVPWLAGNGQAMLDVAVDQDLEGVLAKRLGSLYRPGRSRDWRKIYATRTITVVVGGIVVGRHGGVEALVVGVPHPAAGGRLRYAAHVDHGLSPADRHDLAGLLLARRSDHSPFLGRVPTAGWHRPPRPIVILRPEVSVQITHRGFSWGGERRKGLGLGVPVCDAVAHARFRAAVEWMKLRPDEAVPGR
jgi:bifunctional non-homologous end joining protein LigD